MTRTPSDWISVDASDATQLAEALTSRCLNIAHRGASALAPENTLAAFRKAIEAGADMVELDVRLTRDGHLVVIHDGNVRRTTNGSGLVARMTLEEVKALDAGSRFSPAFVGEKIPTLDEVIGATRGRIALNVEVKAPPVAEDLVIHSLLRTLAGAGVERDVLVSSFWRSTLRKLRKRSALVRTALLYNVAISPVAAAKAVGATALHPNVAMVSQEIVRKAHEEGLAVNVWTVDGPREMRRLRSLGVDGIITNNPSLLREVLGPPTAPAIAR